MPTGEVACRPPRRFSSGLSTTLAVLAAWPATGIQPRPIGHFLTDTELANITAIECLEARQHNPAVRCLNASQRTEHEPTSRHSSFSFSGQLNAGNYPHYQDDTCNSNGEFLCDPMGIFTKQERKELAAELRRLRENNPVVCGHLLNDKVDPRHYQPFYLGVATARKWPSSMLGPDSLQQLGQIVAAEWNMDERFVGHSLPYLRCPNTAMLIFMPDVRRAFLSAASCEFICQDLGGPEVNLAALMALDNHGPAAAVRAAMQEAYQIVSRRQVLPTLHKESDNLLAENSSAEGGMAQGAESETTPVMMQRALFGFALAALIGSIVFAIMLLLVMPGWVSTRRRRK